MTCCLVLFMIWPLCFWPSRKKNIFPPKKGPKYGLVSEKTRKIGGRRGVNWKLTYPKFWGLFLKTSLTPQTPYVWFQWQLILVWEGHGPLWQIIDKIKLPTFLPTTQFKTFKLRKSFSSWLFFIFYPLSKYYILIEKPKHFLAPTGFPGEAILDLCRGFWSDFEGSIGSYNLSKSLKES